MGSLDERLAAVTDRTAKLIAQLNELKRLRARLSKAQLVWRSRRIGAGRSRAVALRGRPSLAALQATNDKCLQPTLVYTNRNVEPSGRTSALPR